MRRIAVRLPDAEATPREPVEVTFCGFPDSVPDIVVTNIVAKVPH